MANLGAGEPELSRELRAAIRREAIATSTKWVIGLVVLLLGFAATGWWFYLKQNVIDWVGGVPSRAVVAFDNPPARPCPLGWEVFKEATSRMVVGAGNRNDFYEEKYAEDEQGRPLTPRAYRQHGGEEIHKLSVSEMPAHVHSYTFSDGQNSPEHPDFSANEFGLKNVAADTSSAGGDQSHNNMSPYIALYYCVKL